MNVEKQEQKGRNSKVFRILIAGILSFFMLVLLAAETYVLITKFVPLLSICIFQETGISIGAGLTFAEFSVGDFVVMLMMWFIPSLVMTLLIVCVQWALIKWVFRKVHNIWRNAMIKKSVTTDVVTEEQKSDASESE